MLSPLFGSLYCSTGSTAQIWQGQPVSGSVWPELPACPPLPEQAAGLLIKYKTFAGRGCSDSSLGLAWSEALVAFSFPWQGKGRGRAVCLSRLLGDRGSCNLGKPFLSSKLGGAEPVGLTGLWREGDTVERRPSSLSLHLMAGHSSHVIASSEWFPGAGVLTISLGHGKV